MRLTFRNKTTLWFFLALGILLTTVVFIYQSFRSFDEQKNLVTHTYEVISHIDEIVSQLKDVQSAQRGYVITGQLDYLTPYSMALPKIDDLFARVESMTRDNPVQQANIKTLKEETTKRVAIAVDVIATYQNEGQEQAFAKIRSGAGKKEMDQIRFLVLDMIALEQSLLNLRQKNVDQASTFMLLLGGFGFLVCALILGAVFVAVYREGLRRERVEKTLKIAFSDLKLVSEQDKLMGELTDYLQGCKSTDEAYSIIEQSIPSLLPNTSGNVYMFNSSRNILATKVHWGAQHAEHDFLPEQCWALRRGQIHHVTAHGHEPLCIHMGDARATGGSVCYPMQAHGDTIGCFYVAADNADDLNENVIHVIRRLGEQISLAISNLNLQNRLRDQSIRDPLTGLFNRRYLEETMDRELSRAERGSHPLSVLVLDIDHFKRYNDTRGHDAGDALLAEFAKLVQGKIRKEDIACRYGGEEFVVVLPMADVENAMMRATSICEATRNMQVKINNDTFGSVTVSIGVATFPGHGNSSAELISKADGALYFAKNNGRNQVKAS